MTDMNRTHIRILLDKSGSMAAVWNDTVQSILGFIREQKNVPGKCSVDISVFPSFEVLEPFAPKNFNGTSWFPAVSRYATSKVVSDFETLEEIPETLEFPRPGGGTPLNDAICESIDELGRKFALMPEAQRPGKVIFAIVTDGEENSSSRFTNEDVKGRIKLQESGYSWGFIYLGANQDAFHVGSVYGLNPNQVATYNATASGVNSAYSNLSASVARSRTSDLMTYDSLQFTVEQQLEIEKTK